MSLEPCAWCGAEAVTEVVVVPGRKNKRYQPVAKTTPRILSSAE